MRRKEFFPAGVGVALLAAACFGASTPFAKLLLGGEKLSPTLLAGLLYLGSGGGLAMFYFAHGQKQTEAPLARTDWPWLAGAIGFGGVLGPLLLMWGLSVTPGTTASLLLNLEGVFTALLAWFLFRENFDKRIALGMILILSGGVLLSWQGGALRIPPGALAIIGACLCWGIDNNLTQKVSGGDPVQITMTKGLVAGGVNTALALATGATWPASGVLGGALLLGFVGYGLSLTLFVLALRHIGTARTGAYFSVAPFVGAAISILLLREAVSPLFLVAGVLMAAGVWLHLSESHSHDHAHEPLEHSHRHVHDAHHQHEHAPNVNLDEPHSHQHIHEPMTHAHPHFPDIHHRHEHNHDAEISTK